jgi:hypothetical protein
MRGSSGATFITGDGGIVYKHGIGNDRVRQQGDWLMRHGGKSMPKVYVIGRDDGDPEEDFYGMEPLTGLPITLVDPWKIIQGAARILESEVWTQGANADFDEEQHKKRVAPLFRFVDDETRRILARAVSRIDWSAQTPCLTHGDPIIDNVMLRGDDVVLIDPIPATPAIPDIRCVDIGRLLQSASGYERIRYGIHELETVPYDWVLNRFDLNASEYDASLYFGAIHLLRSMVYVDTSIARMIHDNCFMHLMREIAWIQ